MKFLVTMAALFLMVSCAKNATKSDSTIALTSTSKYKALPVPDNVRVISSEPRKIVWGDLTDKEKNLATHLIEASKAGKTIIYNQNHRHALSIKAMIEISLSSHNRSKTKALLGNDGYKEFLNYAAKFEDLLGPYESSNRKYLLTKVTPKQVDALFKKAVPTMPADAREESVRLLTDPNYEVIAHPENDQGTDLELSGGNMYEHGLTGAEVNQAFKNGLKSGLNCRIVRGISGKPECEVQALNNPHLQPVVQYALKKVVEELKKAVSYASTDHQEKEINYLISYFENGNVDDFRKMNVEWVQDGTKSKVDFMMGYVEVYEDYLNQIGSWESYVQIIDPKMTDLSVRLAHNAQEFENAMPYGKYKKTFPADYSPPALMVYYFQELSSFHSGGYNLPNFDDIRRDVGAKNIIKLDLPGQDKDPITIKVRREMYQEFLEGDKVDLVMKHWLKQRRAIVLLHEIIGHGSGTYDTSKYGPKEDPVGALGALASALEEQRADLTALVFSGDKILVDVGFYKNIDEAKHVRDAMYDAYLANFLQGVSKQGSLSEAHQRGHWLLINLLMAQGAVEKVSRDGKSPVTDDNFVLAVKDYDKYYKISYDLLAELQRIKAERDENALKDLFTKSAPLSEINTPWMQAVIKRGRKLAINAGTLEQPWSIVNGKVMPYGTVSLEGVAGHLSK